MKGSFSIVFLLSLTTLMHAQAPFGVNLDNANAFVNIVNHTARYSEATGYDANGWPTSDFSLVLMDARPATEWSGTIDDPDVYRRDVSGRYLCSFKGLATLTATGTAVQIENQTYDAATNVTSFDLVVGAAGQPNHGLVFLRFANTQRSRGSFTPSGISELRVHRPGYARTTTQVFTDEFLRLCRAAPFQCYRFYNVQNIWEGEPTWPEVTRWGTRKGPEDAAQVSMAGLNGKRDGWCWEYIIELANTLGKDIWINIHQSCDSTYVHELARMLQRDLNPAINIYVESSNEVWSPTQATHGPYNAARAASLGITFDQAHAHRTVELSRWFAYVFGAAEINQRIRIIMAGQHAYNGRSDNHLTYINQRFGPPSTFIYATSTATYHGSTAATDLDPVVIANGMIDDIRNQITNGSSNLYRQVHITKAAQWNLVGGCTSYEGGPHLPAGGGTANLAAQIRAHRTQQMADAICYNYNDAWFDIGGGLAIYFTLASAYNRYGCWGITDDPAIPDRNYKLSAIKKILEGATGVGVDQGPKAEDREDRGPRAEGQTLLFDLLGRRIECTWEIRPDGTHIPVVGGWSGVGLVVQGDSVRLVHVGTP
jgi:hypothetical protein